LTQATGPRRDPDPPDRPFAGILHQIAQDFLQILSLSQKGQGIGRTPVDLDRFRLKHPLQHHRQFVDDLAHRRPLPQPLRAGGGAGAAQMVIDLSLHHL